MKSKPAIVIVSEFTYSTKKSVYGGYLNYINRPEAKENVINDETNNFHEYLDYLADGKKNGTLFDNNNDYIDEVSRVTSFYNEAEKKGSPLWKDIISFNNTWLEEQGLYNSKTGWMNEAKMKEVIRESVNEMIKVEKMRDPIWSASFHHNTQNIHVHVATVDLDPSDLPLVQAQARKSKKKLFDEQGEPIMQRRGKRKPKTLERMKSVVANKIIDRTPYLQRIDELVRDNARQVKKKNIVKINETKALFLEGIKRLPEDLTQWKYGYDSVDEARPYIDRISEVYLETKHKDVLEELTGLIDGQVLHSEELYGADSNHAAYKENKFEDLKKRMGNAVLSEMRAHVKGLNTGEMNKSKIKKGYHNNGVYYNFSSFNAVKYDMRKSMYALNKALALNYQEHKQAQENMAEFEESLQQEIKREI